MTFHFTAQLPERGIGIISDSVVSYVKGDGTHAILGKNPKTFILSQYAAISCAGDASLCLNVVENLYGKLNDNAVFADIAPLIQKSYVEEAEKTGYKDVELILAAKTKKGLSKCKIIKYIMKANGKGLKRLEDKDHYSAGLNLPDLEIELCRLLTTNYKRTYKIEKKLGEFLEKSLHVIHSPKSFPLGICFGAFMPLIQEYVQANGLGDSIGGPWTILLIPEDGKIHFQNSRMYDGSQSLLPKQIKEINKSAL